MLSRPRPRTLVALLAALIAVVLVAAGCGGRSAQTGQQAKTIKIGYIAWDEDIAVSNLYAALLEKQGYQVQLTELDAGPLYAGVAQGSVDLFLDAWLPSTHGDYWKQYQGKMEDLGVWYNSATLNLAVPNYMTDVNSIADLSSKTSMLNGMITGIDPGAGETRIVRNDVMPAYGLTGPFQLQTSSSTAMIASLEKAINNKQPIVVTLWHPKGALGQPEELHSAGRSNFSRDFPDVAGMVKKFKLDDKTLASLENAVQAAPKGQEKAVAAKWAEQNPDVINSFAASK
jgi:glycine betaine/proline transport system substrate-binding protein